MLSATFLMSSEKLKFPGQGDSAGPAMLKNDGPEGIGGFLARPIAPPFAQYGKPVDGYHARLNHAAYRNIVGFHRYATTDESLRIVRKALDEGINFLDNCWDYNGGEKLPPRIGRESHHGIVLDPVQHELDDAPLQREASEPRQGRIRRKDFHLPVAQVLGFPQIDQPVQLQPDFHVLCRYPVIVVEQMENQSPTVGFPSQLAQHVTPGLQTEARSSCCVFGARRNSRLRLSRPDDDTAAGGESIQSGLLLVAELG
jgi:hypothetical protein